MENEQRKVLQRSIILGGIWESEVGDKQAMRKHEKAVAIVREINSVKEFIKRKSVLQWNKKMSLRAKLY